MIMKRILSFKTHMWVTKSFTTLGDSLTFRYLPVWTLLRTMDEEALLLANADWFGHDLLWLMWLVLRMSVRCSSQQIARSHFVCHNFIQAVQFECLAVRLNRT